MDLPMNYTSRMKTVLGETFEGYLKSLDEGYYRGLRFNPLKVSSPENYISYYVRVVEPIGFCNQGYYYDQEENVSKNPLYYGGFYYIQEPSAMAPVAYLGVEPGMRVLDLCAAPGGKSTQIGGLLQGEGLLVSNDLSVSRAYGLLKNIELFGIRNALVISEEPEKMIGYFQGYFDRILIDAPCSGEGMFRKNPKMINDWVAKGPDYYAPIQKSIMKAAIKMLKPGGEMIYSTCTFSTEENEEVIAYGLSCDPDLELMNIEKDYGFVGGAVLPEVARLFPHLIKGEGHFMGKLRKKTSKNNVASTTKSRDEEKTLKKQLTNQEQESFNEFVLDLFGKNPFASLQYKKESLYEFNLDMERTKGLRTLRSGWLIGSFKKERFEPSQALASGLKAKDVLKAYDFKPDDPLLFRYFKGETLQIPLEKGYWLLTIDGQGIGFGKSDGKRLKNKFNPSWLMN